MKFTILVVKENRESEQRVGLIPDDVAKLCDDGHKVYVEADAGVAAGFSNHAYQQSGAMIRTLADEESLSSYHALFQGINCVVRVKRPQRVREQLEMQAMAPGTIMIGALSPLVRESTHVAEYQQARIAAYSLDQLKLPADHPLNILTPMSDIAGRLAFIDAIKRSTLTVKSVVIIGFGVVGRAAWAEALKQGQRPTVVLTDSQQLATLKQAGSSAVWLDRQASVELQQQMIAPLLADADIVISSARHAGERAPLLISTGMLQTMKSGCVIVDMALAEGGNVAGSRYDTTLTLANGVVITNVSGYPKVLAHEVSVIWSGVSLHAVQALAKEDRVMAACLLSGGKTAQ